MFMLTMLSVQLTEHIGKIFVQLILRKSSLRLVLFIFNCQIIISTFDLRLISVYVSRIDIKEDLTYLEYIKN